MPPESADEMDMQAIDPTLVLQQALPWALGFIFSHKATYLAKWNVPITT